FFTSWGIVFVRVRRHKEKVPPSVSPSPFWTGVAFEGHPSPEHLHPVSGKGAKATPTPASPRQTASVRASAVCLHSDAPPSVLLRSSVGFLLIPSLRACAWREQYFLGPDFAASVFWPSRSSDRLLSYDRRSRCFKDTSGSQRPSARCCGSSQESCRSQGHALGL